MSDTHDKLHGLLASLAEALSKTGWQGKEIMRCPALPRHLVEERERLDALYEQDRALAVQVTKMLVRDGLADKLNKAAGVSTAEGVTARLAADGQSGECAIKMGVALAAAIKRLCTPEQAALIQEAHIVSVECESRTALWWLAVERLLNLARPTCLSIRHKGQDIAIVEIVPEGSGEQTEPPAQGADPAMRQMLNNLFGGN